MGMKRPGKAGLGDTQEGLRLTHTPGLLPPHASSHPFIHSPNVLTACQAQTPSWRPQVKLDKISAKQKRER